MAVNTHLIRNYIRHFFSATRKGHSVHSPFVYQLCEEVFYNNNHFYDFEELNSIRLELLKNHSDLTIDDFGAGSKTFKSASRKVSQIAAKGISTKKQSELFYKLINFLQPNSIIELGTSLGLNTLYLAKAKPDAMVCTVEGAKNLSDFARTLALNHKIRNVEFLNNKFDLAFPGLLEKMNGCDFIYVDGNHTFEATMRYFTIALSKKSVKTVIVFDDIYWSGEMTKAWKTICENALVTLSIDAFYFGMVFFKPEIREKINVRVLI